MMVAGGVASLIGPASAALYETGHLRLLPNAGLLEVWLLAVIAVLGVGVGAFSVLKGNKVGGTICILTNGPVLIFYGFLGAFFTMGGSR